MELASVPIHDIALFQMGYGKQALKLLKNYYSGNFTKLDETNDDEESDNGKAISLSHRFIKIILNKILRQHHRRR